MRQRVQERYIKGNILLALLERIGEGVQDVGALSVAILEAGYGASYGKMSYEFSRERARIREAARRAEVEMKARRRYQKMISALKKDGLLEEQKRSHHKALVLTKKGIEKLVALRMRKQEMLPPVAYHAEPADVFTIVTFDIPERERRKRNWLRAVLKRLGFTFVQKSVWMGKIRVPEELLADLRRLDLIDFVEIFQITKVGSLKHVT